MAQRREISLNETWRFVRQDVQRAHERHCDDSTWTTIDLPHTWNADDATGGRSDYYRGPGWYRRVLAVDASDLATRQFYLWFGAASSSAQVFVNGKSAGAHDGAFAAFCFDITSLLLPGDNVVAVRVTNAFDRRIAPISGDFNICGGLYRGAKLLVLPKTSISPLDEGSCGIYVTQKVSDLSAEILAATQLRNARDSAHDVTVTCHIRHADGTPAHAPVSLDTRLDPRSERRVELPITLDRPRLWNGRIDPYLYTVVVEVRDSAGEVDRVSVPIGLRWFRVDPIQGFILNGKPYDLHGVNRHQDFARQSWAVTLADVRKDFELIQEMGCTMVRLAHYQHSGMFESMCDAAGIIVWAELGLVNEIDFSQDFSRITRQQLRELIKQNFNHPSICAWGLYNELWFKDRADEQLRFMRELNDLAHQLDPTRLTTGASDRPPEHPGNEITDLVAFNRYWGWYVDRPQDWPGKLDELQAKSPRDRAIGIGEYGAGASVHQHELDPTKPQAPGRWHPEEWQCVVHEHAYSAMRSRADLWCKLIWVFADFPAAWRTEGDTVGMNDKGVVSFERDICKDVFFFYKAHWSAEPVIHITSRRFTPRPMPTMPVKVYSNCDEVELRVNGRVVGNRRGEDRVFVFDSVSLQPGENRIEARGQRAGQKLVDECVIVHDPAMTTQPAR